MKQKWVELWEDAFYMERVTLAYYIEKRWEDVHVLLETSPEVLQVIAGLVGNDDEKILEFMKKVNAEDFGYKLKQEAKWYALKHTRGWELKYKGLVFWKRNTDDDEIDYEFCPYLRKED